MSSWADEVFYFWHCSTAVFLDLDFFGIFHFCLILHQPDFRQQMETPTNSFKEFCTATYWKTQCKDDSRRLSYTYVLHMCKIFIPVEAGRCGTWNLYVCVRTNLTRLSAITARLATHLQHFYKIPEDSSWLDLCSNLIVGFMHRGLNRSFYCLQGVSWPLYPLYFLWFNHILVLVCVCVFVDLLVYYWSQPQAW